MTDESYRKAHDALDYLFCFDAYGKYEENINIVFDYVYELEEEIRRLNTKGA